MVAYGVGLPGLIASGCIFLHVCISIHGHGSQRLTVAGLFQIRFCTNPTQLGASPEAHNRALGLLVGVRLRHRRNSFCLRRSHSYL